MDVDQLLNDIDCVMDDEQLIPVTASNSVLFSSDKLHEPAHHDNAESVDDKNNSDNVLNSNAVQPAPPNSELLAEMENLLNASLPNSDEEDVDIGNVSKPSSNSISRNNSNSTAKCNQLTFMSLRDKASYCKRIRCLHCDHLVAFFTGHKWDDSVNYLFFRLNFPNQLKLQAKLIDDANYCCYACQCQYLSINLHKDSNSQQPTLLTIRQHWQCCGQHV